MLQRHISRKYRVASTTSYRFCAKFKEQAELAVGKENFKLRSNSICPSNWDFCNKQLSKGVVKDGRGIRWRRSKRTSPVWRRPLNFGEANKFASTVNLPPSPQHLPLHHNASFPFAVSGLPLRWLSTSADALTMGRKSRFDRQARDSNDAQHHADPEPFVSPKRHITAQSRSPSPDRRKDDPPSYHRAPRERAYERPKSPSSSAYRGREPFSSSRTAHDVSSYSNHARDASPLSLRDRIEQPRVREDDYRRADRYASPERIQNRPRSPSPSYHHDAKHKKYKQSKKSRFDVKKSSKGYETEKYSNSPNHRPRDIYKPVRNGDGSRPSSSHTRRESESARSPSPRHERISQSSGGREYHGSAPSSASYNADWRHSSQGPEPPRSPPHRHAPEKRDYYAKHPPVEYENRSPAKSSSQRRYEDYPAHPKDYERRDYEKPKLDPPKRQRGGDYDREEWERTHREEMYPPRNGKC